VEADLTAEYGVSRGSLREALRLLSAEGLVEIVPHRGALVRRLTRVEALELFEIRAELEAMACRRAAAAIAAEEPRRRFAAAVAEVFDDQPRHSTAEYVAENGRFHAAIIAEAGNAQLVRLNDNLQLGLIMAQIGTLLPTKVIATSLVEHRRIAEALMTGDGRAAEAALRAHLGRAMDYLRSLPEAVFRRP
jgi:DNA-binding GntR family transcriptional regulator